GAGAVAGLVLPVALRLALRLPDDLPALGAAVALADARRVVAVDEAVLLDAADRDLDDAIAALPDDRLLGDDVRDVVADGLAHLGPMPRPVAGRTIASLGVRGRVRSEDRLDRPRHAAAPQSFQRLLAAYLSVTSTQLGQ